MRLRALNPLLVVGALCGTVGPAFAQSGDCITRPVQRGTEIRVVPAETVCGSFATVGDPIEFRVVEAIEVNDLIVIEEGAPVLGEIVAAESNGRGGGGGTLKIELEEVEHVRGETIDLAAEGATLEIVGDDRGFFGKLFTLWIAKGEDACVDPVDPPVVVRTGEFVSVCVPTAGNR